MEIEHIKLENNMEFCWNHIFVHRNREIDHIEFEEFVNLIEEIKEAGWNQRVASPNEPISKIDLMHVFAKVDVNGDQRIDTRVFAIFWAQTFFVSPGDETGV